MSSMELQIAETQTIYLCILAITIGVCATILKTLSILLFCLSKDLRQKYLLFMVLDFGEVINGIAYITTGIGRVRLLAGHDLFHPIYVFQCLTTKPWPYLLIMGAQLPAIFTVLISMERVIAVQFPALFVRIYSNRTKHICIGVSVLLELVSLAFATLSSVTDNEEFSTQHCPIISSVNKYYATFHFVATFLAYVISFISLLVLYYVQSQLNVSGNIKKESKLSLYLFTTGTAIVFVSIPAVIMIAIRWELFIVGELISSLAYLLPGVTAIGTSIANLLFRKDYRSQLKSLVKMNFSSLARIADSRVLFTTSTRNNFNQTIKSSRVI